MPTRKKTGRKPDAEALEEEIEYVEIVEALQAKAWREVELADIDIGDRSFQFRLTTSSADLRRSLEDEGQREPIDVFGKKPYRVADGFRRIQAAQELQWPSLKAFVHATLDDDEAFRLAFTKNVVRRNLAPLEKANAMFLARQRGVATDGLAELFGLSEKQVGRYLKLLDFPPAVQAVLDGEIVTMAHAKLLADYQPANIAAWAKRIATEGLDAKSLRRELRRSSGKKPAGRKKQYVRRAKGRIRFYPFSVSLEGDPAERRHVIAILEETLAALKKAR